jgi:hypothetical protein
MLNLKYPSSEKTENMYLDASYILVFLTTDNIPTYSIISASKQDLIVEVW